MVNHELAIGIDLGTTNSAIAVWRNGQAEIIPNSQGKYLTPSVVSMDDNEQLLVGDAAYSRLITNPHQTVSAFKRFLGTEKCYLLGEQQYTPVELCALVLKSLKADAEVYLEQSIRNVVIAVPSYFNDQQREEIHRAAVLADLYVVRLINEPVAACLAYSLHLTHEHRFLVFDLGGGTFDVTVVGLQRGTLEVLAATGDHRLGGDDFTAALSVFVMNQLTLNSETVPLADLSKIFQVCEQAKQHFSTETKIILPAPWNQEIVVTEAELEQIWQGLLRRLALSVKQVLFDAHLESKDIDELIFVGGATRLREVYQMVIRQVGRFGRIAWDPDLVIAMGAAVVSSGMTVQTIVGHSLQV
ncbi:Hsp70 family protein [Vibrio mangrovi]|uniref:Chaperone protein HscC n=1 Tax=Vibrio mangrovi TaxID=474394 RepID=A0A1Y6ISR2_9VIBR|nr:Hsp70 family protein [Vibrio mangrovi]MDW6001311.1 Hsp70 family protein [Vibrio mangrovi]SMS00668.1 Chaperone protein HscC [Vibrio mangrovi]